MRTIVRTVKGGIVGICTGYLCGLLQLIIQHPSVDPFLFFFLTQPLTITIFTSTEKWITARVSLLWIEVTFPVPKWVGNSACHCTLPQTFLSIVGQLPGFTKWKQHSSVMLISEHCCQRTYSVRWCDPSFDATPQILMIQIFPAWHALFNRSMYRTWNSKSVFSVEIC